MSKRTLKNLWAPWRMEYIGQPSTCDCFLCEAFTAGTDPAWDRDHLILLRSTQGAVMMNRFPYNNGHLLIAPYRHVPDLGSLNCEERVEMMELFDRCVKAMQATLRPDGFNLGFNLGRAAGAGLEDHLHGHIVPRWNGDTNFMPVLGDVKVIPQSLLALYDVLKPHFQA